MEVIDNKTGKVLKDVTVLNPAEFKKWSYDERERLICVAEAGGKKLSEIVLSGDLEKYAEVAKEVDKMWLAASEYEDFIMMSLWDNCVTVIDDPSHRAFAHNFMKKKIEDIHLVK